MAAPARTSWRALGTTAVVEVDGGGEPGAPLGAFGVDQTLASAVRAVSAELDAIDRVASRFRADSELCALNRAAGRRTALSPRMLEALELALDAAEATGGAVDPTLGAQLVALGYDRDIDALIPAPPQRLPVPSPRARIPARRAPAWRGVELHRYPPTARIPAGIALDLGATAKALAADRCARAVHAATEAAVLVSLGGDIATCGRAPGTGWTVRVTDDHRDRRPSGQLVRIGDGGLATSSVLVRRWIQRDRGRDGTPDGDRVHHHILDPRTGQPVRGPWRTASVMASTCAGANVASTAAIVLGDEAPAWLAEQGVPARLVTHDGEVVALCGWPS